MARQSRPGQNPVRSATSGGGRIRLVEIPDVALQPCAGNKIGRTGAIGTVLVLQIERKRGGVGGISPEGKPSILGLLS